MFKSKNLLIILLIVLWIPSFLPANQEKRSSLYYIKLGVAHPCGDSSYFLPSLGLGARFQKGYYGFDLSASHSTLVFMNYASLKGMFLFYPQPEKKHQLYLGVGPGIGCHFGGVPMGAPFGGASSKRWTLNLEGVLGYEFRHTAHFKTFIQLELTQPVFGFGEGHRGSYKPGFALMGGIGF